MAFGPLDIKQLNKISYSDWRYKRKPCQAVIPKQHLLEFLFLSFIFLSFLEDVVNFASIYKLDNIITTGHRMMLTFKMAMLHLSKLSCHNKNN